MKKPQLFQYFPLKAKSSGESFEFTALGDFQRFAELHNHRSVFLLTDEKDAITHFAIIHNGELLQKATEGYKALEDYLASMQQHFPDAASYYESQEMGYSAYEDYKLVKEAGINDQLIFNKIKEQGYIKGFADFASQRIAEPGLPDTGTLENPYSLYQFATKQGFTSYDHFMRAWKNGFTDAALHTIAVEKGYAAKADYDAGSKAGFMFASDYIEAKKLKVRDKNDFDRYLDLEFLHHTGYTYDQRILLALISKLPQGKKVSINKLDELYKKALEEYRYKDTEEMPLWLTITFTGRNSIIEFLLKSDHVKKYGHYDNDGEYFETNHLKERKIVIDGSNVAHNSKGSGQSKAYVINMIRLVEELKKRGFTEITIISDASLKHKLADGERLAKLKEMVEYTIAPPENTADIFIIQYVKRHRCLLVSNDTFHEWKIKDPWTAENIDYYRISFMINNDSVLLPDLDQ